MINKHIYIFIFIINLSFLFAQGMSKLEDSQNVFDTSKLRNEISSKVKNQFKKIVSQAQSEEVVIIDQGKCGDNAYWNLTNDGTLTIWGQGKIDYYANVEKQPWRKYRSQIKNVIVKEEIENLHCNAFLGLEQLENISFPNSLKYLYVGSFSRTTCPSLKTLHLPNSIQLIHGSISSFNIEIDGGLDSVLEGTCGPDAKFKFDKNTGTLRIYGSGNIDVNYKWHFYKERIKKVYIKDTISNIPQQAFIDCHNLESVYMTNKITHIGFQAFALCRSLKKISIPQTVVSIRENLFIGCSPNLVVKAPKSLKGKMKEEDYIKIEYY